MNFKNYDQRNYPVVSAKDGYVWILPAALEELANG